MAAREKGIHELTDPDKEIFSLSGPVHLTSVDWENSDHRRIIIASLVNGVYTLEYDRQKNRKETSKANTTTWWSTFGFRLCRELVDDKNQSIFGAIYEFNFSAPRYNGPKYVVAFRGTVLTKATIGTDFNLNAKFMLSTLHSSSRSQLATQAVQDLVSREGANNVLVAGHSLGSALALLTGKNMAKEGYPIETYLFNPPFPSLPIDHLSDNPNLTHGVRVLGSFVKTVISVADKKKDDSFSKLSEWIPKVFVNTADPISCGYVHYFEHRRRMQESGYVGEWIARRATQISIGSKISGVLGNDSETLHLLPSADLTINESSGIKSGKQWRKAHELRQWLDPSPRFQFEMHRFK